MSSPQGLSQLDLEIEIESDLISRTRTRRRRTFGFQLPEQFNMRGAGSCALRCHIKNVLAAELLFSRRVWSPTSMSLSTTMVLGFVVFLEKDLDYDH
jgi:hypothetical protein